ncbi:acyl-coa-binding domain-containing protein [Anaeramoeba flamelloides]|uniref:Acyl-coa-binding domain-containing protein n=1 Tax=Anaeramoeba flamelloides TaxID=1746091 RepID=A0ABQ8Y2P8_9EUKA|nr:acyl-coa-binding domain-containing protein [Anaeramoeba flamelloides]
MTNLINSKKENPVGQVPVSQILKRKRNNYQKQKKNKKKGFTFEFLSLHELILPEEIYSTQQSFSSLLNKSVESQLSQWEIAANICNQTFMKLLKDAILKKYCYSRNSRLLFDAVCLKYLISKPKSAELFIGPLGEEIDQGIKEKEKEMEKRKSIKTKQRSKQKKNNPVRYSERAPPFSDILSQFVTLRNRPNTNLLILLEHILKASMKWPIALRSFLTDLLVQAPDLTRKRFYFQNGSENYCLLISDEYVRYQTFQLFTTLLLSLINTFLKENNQKLKEFIIQYLTKFLSKENKNNIIQSKRNLITRLIEDEEEEEEEEDEESHGGNDDKANVYGYKKNKLEILATSKNQQEKMKETEIEMEMGIEQKKEKEKEKEKQKLIRIKNKENLKLNLIESIIQRSVKNKIHYSRNNYQKNSNNQTKESFILQEIIFPTVIKSVSNKKKKYNKNKNKNKNKNNNKNNSDNGNDRSFSKILFERILNNKTNCSTLFSTELETKRIFKLFAQYPIATKIWLNSWNKHSKSAQALQEPMNEKLYPQQQQQQQQQSNEKALQEQHFSKDPILVLKILKSGHKLIGYENTLLKFFQTFLKNFDFKKNSHYILIFLETLLSKKCKQQQLLLCFFSIALTQIPKLIQEIVANITSVSFVSKPYEIGILISKLRFIIEQEPSKNTLIIGSTRVISLLINILEQRSCSETVTDTLILIKYFILHVLDCKKPIHLELVIIILAKVLKMIDLSQVDVADRGIANSLFEKILEKTQNIESPAFVKKLLYLFWNRKKINLHSIELIVKNYARVSVGGICEWFLLKKIRLCSKNDYIKFSLLEIIVKYFPKSVPEKNILNRIITLKILERKKDALAFLKFLLACLSDRLDIIENYYKILKTAASFKNKNSSSSQISDLARAILENLNNKKK